MTLDTRIYVHDEVDYRILFIRCNQLLGAHEGVRVKDDPVRGSIGNLPGQGLDAWLIVYYGKGGPRTPEGAHKSYCEPVLDECPAPCGVPCWAEVSFDTGYGYKGPEGGCGDLHVRLIAQLGQWLDNRGLNWSWLNGFTGEVHHRYARLEELGSGTGKAAR